MLRHLGRGPFSVEARCVQHLRRALAAVGALGDEVGGPVALILQPLDQVDDVAVEIGQLLHPLIGRGALSRRRDTDSAERDSGQGRNGDQQEEAGTDAPVLQPMAWRQAYWRHLRLGRFSRARLAGPPIVPVSWPWIVAERRAVGCLLTLSHLAAGGLIATGAHSGWTSPLLAVNQPAGEQVLRRNRHGAPLPQVTIVQTPAGQRD